MLRWILDISLKIKLVILITALTSCMLLVFAWMSVRDFERDKTEYILDTNQAHVRAAASQADSEIQFAADKLISVVEKSVANPRYKLNDRDGFEAYWVYQWRNSDFRLRREHLRSKFVRKHNTEFSAQKEALIKEALQHDISLRRFKINNDYWVIAQKIKSNKGKPPLVAIGVVQKGGLLEAFSGARPQNTYLIDRKGSVLLQAIQPTFDLDQQQLGKVFKNLLDSDEPVQVLSHKLADKSDWIVSSAKINQGGFSVVAVVEKKSALKIVDAILVKTLIFLGFLVSLTIGAGVLGSHGLTAALRSLLDSMREIGRGNFDVEVAVKSKDEVGRLSKGFNIMTGEIKRLMEETAEKSRMEEELKTAQTVQSTLFPEVDFVSDDYRVHGFYEPASECGGDWWHYDVIDGKIYLWIADATGHGVPAALVTSAAKSASSIIEQIPGIELNRILAMMNNAINATAQGNVCMTFFLSRFDPTTGEFEYCNASHDPPILIPNKSDLTKADLVPLMEVNGPRVGHLKDSVYKTYKLKLGFGDKILFYTDGVTECTNPEGKMFGERKMLKSLLTSIGEGRTSKESIDTLLEELWQFREGAPLTDDVTYFMFERRKKEERRVRATG